MKGGTLIAKGCTWFLLCFCTFALPPFSAAFAAGVEDFVQGRKAYENRKFEEAVRILDALVGNDPPTIKDPLLILESRKYLGASYIFLGRKADGRFQFRKLLEQQEDYVLDASSFPRAVSQAFEEERKAVKDARAVVDRLNRLQQEKQGLEARLKSEEEARKLAEERAKEVNEVDANSRLIAMLPFGIGQFQNKHDSMGWFFLTTEIVLGLGSIGLFISHAIVSNVDTKAVVGQPPGIDPGTFGQPPLTDEQQRYQRVEEALRVTNWITTGLFLLTAIAGIVDAQLRFVPQFSVRKVRGATQTDIGFVMAF